MANVTIEQNPGAYNMAYGANPVTLIGAPLGGKYVLRVLVDSVIVADIRQTPNISNAAVFDLQNILQSLVNTSDLNIETTEEWIDSAREGAKYQIAYGSEDFAGNIVINGTTGFYELLSGRKEYYEVLWDSEPYTPFVEGDDSIPTCTIIASQGKAFTDLPLYRADKFGPERPPQVAAQDMVHRVELTREDFMTMSWMNKVVQDDPPAGSNVTQIAGATVFEWDSAGSIGSYSVFNTTQTGGGPDAQPGDGVAVQYPYSAITLGVGPENREQDNDPSTTHYWVLPQAYNPCGTTQLTYRASNTPIRIDIVEPNCNDYEHIQFSWTNSYGFRDYYTFTKKNEKRLRINKNNFLMDAANYAMDTYDITRQTRGTTTYSQKIELQYTATTDYMTDEEAKYLENLFMAPDVRVRFGKEGFFEPVTILTSSYTQKTNRKDQLFQYEVQFKRAHGIKSQRG